MPLVAIVGRPNVGKSTLFNKLIGHKKAITTNEPGVTRDLNYGEVETGGKSFTLVDTGGFEPDAKEEILAKIREQVSVAIEEADTIVCFMDGRAGLTAGDLDIIDMLRGVEKPVIYAVNKIDTIKQEPLLADFYSSGVEPLIPVSAEHNTGIGALLEEIIATLSFPTVDEEGGKETKIAVLGRPNVGKSTLVNRILGFERVLVTDIPGTTRDTIDTAFERDGKPYRIIDTAGMRRRTRISRRLEIYSVMSAIRSIDGCDVAILMIDAKDGVTAQDARIGGLISAKGKGCIVAVNKWDTVAKDTDTMSKYEDEVKKRLYFLDYAPVHFVSAISGKRVDKLFPAVDSIAASLNIRIPTSRLNRVIEIQNRRGNFPTYRGKGVKIFYITQVGIRPPCFVAFVNYPEGVKDAQRRFLIKVLRESLSLKNVPLKLYIRKKHRDNLHIIPKSRDSGF